jgi:hypothetical protein
MIIAPLKTLTKKDAFSWAPEEAFEQLKEVMCKAPDHFRLHKNLYCGM